MTDHAELRRLAEQASSGNWYGEDSQVLIGKHAVAYCNHKVDAQFIGRANPKTVLALLDEIDGLKAENEALRRFAAEVYQVLGALDAPENVLDNASDAANGVPLRHETLLPFFADDYESMQKDAARYRWLRDSCTRQWDVMCRDIEIVINGDGAEDCEDLDGIIDAVLEGATQ
ncbi:ead/Ea22-like family protein [Pseudomonas aeruginosa]